MAPTETLLLPNNCTLLLHHWLENYLGWQSVYIKIPNSICTNRRWSFSSGWCLEKACYLILGCNNLIVCVDHKPLLKIFSDCSLNNISNLWLHKFKEKTLQYQFIMMHIPGVKHKIPDTLSHYPVSHDILAPNKNSSNAEEAAYTFALTSRNNFQTVTWEKVKIATQSDESMPRLLSTIEHGFPTSKQDLSKEKQEYHQYWDELYSIGSVKDCIVIPPLLWEDILDILHSAHQSVSPMLSRTMETVFWLGITTAVHAWQNRCTDCCHNAPSQPQAAPYPVQFLDYIFNVFVPISSIQGTQYLVAVDSLFKLTHNWEGIWRL